MKFSYLTRLILIISFLLSGCSSTSSSSTKDLQIVSSPNQNDPSASVFLTEALPNLLPTATPIPLSRLTAGKKDILAGDFSQGLIEFQAAISSNSNPDIKSAAVWGMAEISFLESNYPLALDYLRSLTQDYPLNEDVIHGWFLLGETYFSLDRMQEAVQAYQTYLKYRPGLLDDYVYKKIGDAFSSLDDQNSARLAYQSSESASTNVDTTQLQILIANTYLNSGDPEKALTYFDEIYSKTSDDYVKAQMDLLAGKALIAAGKIDDGYDRWRHTVDNYPLAYDSYSALLGLVLANQKVDDFNRGVVDYNANKYDVALSAFQRYASDNPNHDGTVLYYIGLTLREQGNYQSAISAWDNLIENYPSNRYAASAWDDKAYTQWAYLDDYAEAINGLEKFADLYPNSPFSLTYLLEAARILERSGDLEKAAQLWESLQDRFGNDPSLSEAWFQAGIVRFRTGNYPVALKDFQQALLIAKDLQDRARSLLWVGKSYQKNGDDSDAKSSLELAQTTDPNEYYSIRAKDILENRQPFASPLSDLQNYDLASERIEASSWLRIKFNLPADTNLSDLGELSTDVNFKRGLEFWNLGYFDESKLEFDTLREKVKLNPENSFRLGNYLIDLGMYRSGIYSLREVLNLAGLDDHSASLTAPKYFNHVRYGLYYSDIVWNVSSEFKMDPLFITSVMRQESLFEGFVRSDKGARGVMQIIPSTGDSIAAQMGWPPDFQESDLYRPFVSIRMGTYYLNNNRRSFDNDLYATLAGYNSGPGNAQVWRNISNGDLDLELEVIRYNETRNYIRGIYEIYSVYRSLYSPDSAINP